MSGSLRCARWPPAASTTSSAAASRATASTPPGPCRTSRRCSTTTRCSRAPTCTAAQLLGERRLLDVCLDTLEWALREMRGPEGGFYSALDADSEGVEGRFYVWTLAELRERLGDGRRRRDRVVRRQRAGQLRGPAPPGAGLNVLQDRSWRGPEVPPEPEQRERIRDAAARRALAPLRPALDDKRLTAWNALMIAALADAGAALARAVALLGRARRACAEFVLSELRDGAGACCAPTTTAARSSTPTSRTTRSCSRRSSSCSKRPARSAGSSTRPRSPTRSSSASPTPSAAASSRPPPTAKR